MNTQHTPTPWEVGTFGNCGDGFTGYQIWNRSGGEVCILRIAVNQRQDAQLDDFKARVEANARLIVRAVNSHRDLLAALKEAVAYLPRNNSAMHHFWREWLPKAESAIDKAEKPITS